MQAFFEYSVTANDEEVEKRAYEVIDREISKIGLTKGKRKGKLSVFGTVFGKDEEYIRDMQIATVISLVQAIATRLRKDNIFISYHDRY